MRFRVGGARVIRGGGYKSFLDRVICATKGIELVWSGCEMGLRSPVFEWAGNVTYIRTEFMLDKVYVFLIC